MRLWLPLLAFAALLAVVATALYKPADRAVHSALVGQPLPAFRTEPLLAGRPGVASAADGKPRLINVYASWCLPCIAEAPQLMRLKAAGVRIDGIAVRDTPEAMRQFLARNGDPYAAIGADKDGAVQLALGSSGVPETFLVDGRGHILDQHIGDIRADEVDGILKTLGQAR
ncbi:redoxin family protein [Sphingomonas immobilis]|uniref:Redoxin family protein n=1 Tax=Sphingomonas immobilis TaxID=3063997 RepID=A0ABT9A512_9SPHN|nr:redoxin family protein [Sphingomonas sp. CA1-15]MDO7844310.1 redoxin family protein [Sphingomonas sp. CA1-15]